MTARLLALAGAGILGTLARYGLQHLGNRGLAAGGWPWGTIAVNALGCLVFGIVWSLADERLAIGQEVKAAVLVGFLGAFTTFSSFAFEAAQMLRAGALASALAYVAVQNVAGVALVFLGMTIARRIP